MSQPSSPNQISADMLALQLTAERAGSAWACPFSSSEEFEAAVIEAKRNAGVYARAGARRSVASAVVAAALSAALVLLLLVFFV